MPSTAVDTVLLPRPHPSLALVAYGEELCRGGRIAIFGDATLPLAEEFLARGARLVHVYDVEPARLAEATAQRHDRSIFYAAFPEGGDIGVRDGAFDLVFVPDLCFGPEPAELVAVARRVLSPSGAALMASPNVEARSPLLEVSHPTSPLDYYELYEIVAEHFSCVRMLGQAPFVGYAVAEFSADEPEPTVDTSLADEEGKDADWFVALASDKDIHLDSFALIELPVRWTKRDEGTLAHSAPIAPPEEDTPVAGTVVVNVAEAEREAALEALHQQEQLVKEERFRADQATRQLDSRREELTLLRERCETLQKALEQEETRRSAVELELENLRQSPEWASLRERLHALEESSQKTVEEHEHEVASLEERLLERGRETQSLEAEVDRRDRLVRELVATNLPKVTASPASSGNGGHESSLADLSARLDRMAGEAAKREADLVAARWKIAQLERELSQPR